MSQEKPPERVSEEDWQAYLEHKRDWEKIQKQRFENELKNSPPQPPWEKYPEHDSGSMFWRMGTGEDYLIECFLVYLRYASETEIAEYKIKYPAPEDWQECYKDT